MSTRVQRSEYQNLIPIQTFEKRKPIIIGGIEIGTLPNFNITICEEKEDTCINIADKLWKTPDNRTIQLCADCEREIKREK